jgi:AI-2 transport protein TqsA
MSQNQASLITACMCILAIVAVAAILIYTESFMVPCVLAGFATFIAAPGVKLLETKCKLPRGLAVLATAGVVVAAVVLGALLVIGSIRQAMGNIEAYQDSVVALANQVSQFAQSLGFNPSHFGRDEVIAKLQELPIFAYFQSAATMIINAASNLVLIVLLVVFLLTGQSFNFPTNSTTLEIETKVRAYLVMKVVLSAITGLLTGVIFLVLGVDMAIMFAFLAFVLNFIPTVGPLVAMILPVPVALIQFGIGWQSVMAIVLPGIVQFYIGNVLETKLTGDSLDLHPVTILVALMFWGLIWGVSGMILATPILVIGKIILNRTPQGAFFAELMAGRIQSRRIT